MVRLYIEAMSTLTLTQKTNTWFKFTWFKLPLQPDTWFKLPLPLDLLLLTVAVKWSHLFKHFGCTTLSGDKGSKKYLVRKYKVYVWVGVGG